MWLMREEKKKRGGEGLGCQKVFFMGGGSGARRLGGVGGAVGVWVEWLIGD